jgi:excisionase family DNA binding protein
MVCVDRSWRLSFMPRPTKGFEMDHQAFRGWLKVKEAAKYCGLSERKIRSLLKEGLRHSRLRSGTILIKVEWVDEYLGGFEAQENEVDRIVDEVVREF